MSADLPTDFEAVEHAPIWLDYWRPRLRLMDWDVTLEVYGLKGWIALGRSAYEAGNCAISASFGSARIRLLDPAAMPADIAPSCRDVEDTIVHELLHLMLPVRESDGTDHAGELRINRVAQALVRERRARADAERRGAVAEEALRSLRATTGEGGHEHP